MLIERSLWNFFKTDTLYVLKFLPFFFHSWSINNTPNTCRREAQSKPACRHVAGQQPEVRQRQPWGQAPSTPRARLHNVTNRLGRVSWPLTMSPSSKRKVPIPKLQEGFWNDPNANILIRNVLRPHSLWCAIWNGFGGTGLALFCFLPPMKSVPHEGI